MKKQLIIFLTLLSFLAVPFASAEDKPITLSISPVKIVIPEKLGEMIKPGDVINREIEITSSIAVDLSLYTQDWQPEGDTSQPKFIPRDEKIDTGASKWVWLTPYPTISLKGNKKKTVKLKITIPKDAANGSYYTAVFFEQAPDKDKGNINIVARVGALILINVGTGKSEISGSIEKFDTVTKVNINNKEDYAPKQSFFGGNVLYRLLFKNTGNVFYKPTGSIKINNMLGKEIATVSLREENVLPNYPRAIISEWQPPIWAFGRYKATILVSLPKTDIELGKIATFWVISWRALGVIFAGFLFILLIIFRKKIPLRISISKK